MKVPYKRQLFKVLEFLYIQINYACILYALGRVYGCLQMVTGKDSIIAILSSHFKNTNFSLECIKKLI